MSHPQLPGEPPEPVRRRLLVSAAQPLSGCTVLLGCPSCRRVGRSMHRLDVAAAGVNAMRCRGTLQE